jgi:hypothetical protein
MQAAARWCLLPLLLATVAGCADPVVRRADDVRLSEALLRLADLALTTADNDADIREVLRHNVQGVRGHQVVFIGGASLPGGAGDPRPQPGRPAASHADRAILRTGR